MDPVVYQRKLRHRPHVSRYFCIRNFFFPDSKISMSTSIRHDHPTRIRIHPYSTQDSSGNIGKRACVEVAILNTVFTVKVGGGGGDLASKRFRIHSVFKHFHSGKRIKKNYRFVCRTHQIRVDQAQATSRYHKVFIYSRLTVQVEIITHFSKVVLGLNLNLKDHVRISNK